MDRCEVTSATATTKCIVSSEADNSLLTTSSTNLVSVSPKGRANKKWVFKGPQPAKKKFRTSAYTQPNLSTDKTIQGRSPEGLRKKKEFSLFFSFNLKFSFRKHDGVRTVGVE